jgi:hypothetical protein
MRARRGAPLLDESRGLRYSIREHRCRWVGYREVHAALSEMFQAALGSVLARRESRAFCYLVRAITPSITACPQPRAIS